MATLTLRQIKGLPLTNAELDNNFSNLDNTKVQLGGDLGGTTSLPVVVKLRGFAVSSTTPTTGQTLTWDGLAYTPISPVSSNISSTVTSVVTSTLTSTYAGSVTSTTITLPAFSAYPNSSVSQTITGNGVQYKVLFQNEEFDTNNNFASSRFTPTQSGYYQLNAVVRFSGTMGTGENMIVLYKNGSEYHRGWNNSGTEVGANFFSMQVSALAYANGTTDFFEIYVQQGSGSNRDITVAHAAGVGNITWFNGVKVPTDIITAVSGTTTVSSTVTSTVITNTASAGQNVITVLDDISNQFAENKRIFTLKIDGVPIVEGIHYVDNRDFSVQIDGRIYNAAVPQTSTLGPWISTFVAERAKSYKVTGSRLIFYSNVARSGQTAEIKINNKSVTRQRRRRYPISPNTIVQGE